MKIRGVFSFVILLLWTVASTLRAGYDFAIDIDGTLVQLIRPGTAILYPRDRVITIDIPVGNGQTVTQQYCLLPHARAFLSALANEPDSSINFISAGSRNRNEALLKAIHIGKKSLWSMTRRLLSEEDLVASRGISEFDSTPGHPGLARVDAVAATSFKKDLQKINPDVRRVILFDDEPAWANAGEESHLVAVRDRDAKGVLQPVGDYSMSVKQLLNNERLPYALGLFDLARERAQKNGHAIEQELFALQWEKKPDGALVARGLDPAELKRRGNSLFEAARPKGFIKRFFAATCAALLRRLKGG